MHWQPPPFLALIVGLFSLAASVVIAADPKVSVTRFKNVPSKIEYFEDTTTVMLLDPTTHTLHISSDEGSTFHPAPNIPAGSIHKLVIHPFGHNMAFALGKGEEHWVSYDRGESWLKWSLGVEGRSASLGGDTLGFHAEESDWILFQARACEDTGSGPWGTGQTCWDETYYTTTAFRTPPTLLLSQTSSCLFARSTREFSLNNKNVPQERVFCIAFDGSQKGKQGGGYHSVKESRLFKSDDWFEEEVKLVDLGIGRRAQGVVGLGVASRYMVVALKVLEAGGSSGKVAGRAGAPGGDPMHLYTSTDGEKWNLARFPHSAMPNLRENAYTIVQSTTHSLAIDVLTDPLNNIGTLFLSDAEGIYFVEALSNTNRNDMGFVDFEALVGLEGIGLANVVRNAQEVLLGREEKKIRSLMTYDDGSSWNAIKPPAARADGSEWDCDASDLSACSLHLWSVSQPHNYGKIFSSSAPGFVMAVGNVGDSLGAYEEGDTFISSDAGLTWRVAQENAHKYEFGDQGAILVVIDDEDKTDHVHYSYDFGKTWVQLDIGVTLRAIVLTTIPDSTSQKFLLFGMLSREDADADGRYATVFLDFLPLQNRKCTEKDMERWYARPQEDKQCLLGHKQWYKRRKPDAHCYVGNKFNEEKGHEEDCTCDDSDFQCDFNYILSDGECVMKGLEPIPAGQCTKPGQQYKGSSGYRKIPGDTCTGGARKDDPIMKDCSLAQPDNGEPSHQTHAFTSPIRQHHYFPESTTMLIQLEDNTVWQSSNEGFNWKELMPDNKILSISMHAFANDRAYLITDSRRVYYTTDSGQSWSYINTPADPNPFGIGMLDFHPTRGDWLIYTGSSDCKDTLSTKCRAVAYYTTDNGRRWYKIDEYVRQCSWARDERLKVDEKEIICESYRDKKGSQRSADYNPMQLVAGKNFYGQKTVLFDSVVGFATFSEFMIVAEFVESQGTLNLQVSLDGFHFTPGQFPPNMKIDNRAYTILESSTDAVFLHVTMSDREGKEWGTIFKSNSNGTYYNVALEYVNRDRRGYTDFEKMIGLDGIAVVNIVANPDDAAISGKKELQTRITHNDGSTWKPLTPPARDSLNQPYDCQSTYCGLHIHGYTERRDAKATYSSPSVAGFMIAVGNVGESLLPYDDSDVFLTRDGGKSWEEVHKDAHLWEYGDSGSVIVLVNDEEATDHVVYSTDEGLTWREYSFNDNLRVESILTVPTETSRKFVLLAKRPNDNEAKSIIVHLDFSRITQRKCVLSIEDPLHDDIEVWSPAESREESCLFGRQVQYYRRIRDRQCYVGETLRQTREVVRNCTCTPNDFECEFNYRRNDRGDCVLIEGAQPRTTGEMEEQCTGWEPYWYERTAYRKIPYSSCEGEGDVRLDRGKRHNCPGLIGGGGGRGFWFWLFLLIIPFAIATIAGWFFLQTGGRQSGTIRLGEHRAFGGSSGGLSTLASIPFFLIGVASTGWAWATEKFPALDNLFSGGRPYRHVPIDDDAEILNAYDDDDD